MKESTLYERMKDYEADYDTKIKSDEFMIVRLDGHKFSKFTKVFKRPFDDIFAKAMEKCTIDLVQEYNAVTGFTGSDEITLVFPPKFKTRLKPINYTDIDVHSEDTDYIVYDLEDNYIGVL